MLARWPSGSVAALEAAVATVASRLEVPAGAYRPSEPQALLQVPRAVLRVDLADPDEGYVVIYRAGDAAGAASLAADLAAYLGTGLGLTNYPADTRFSVALVGHAVVFTSWSPGRSSDRERGEAVFEALASVGQPVEVVR
jgi:ABC-type sugar transport system substrate-binding protein